MESTISIFKRLHSSLPPLFPEEIKKKMESDIENIKKNKISIGELEDRMIGYGYHVWPWIEAYREMLVLSEARVGEHFFLPKLSSRVAERFNEFKNYGGTLKDLHSGRPAVFFTAEEREELRKALIEMRLELRSFTDREVAGTDRKKYLRKVEEFSEILEEIKSTLNHLKELGDKEEHPLLSGEIKARVRGFEYGLCFLGPKVDHRAVKESVQHFKGRKQELGRLHAVLVVK